MSYITPGRGRRIAPISRLRRIEHSGRYFFVTTNLARNAAPLAPRERDTCLDLLANIRAMHGFLLFGYVMMPTHAHLLVAMFDAELPMMLREWKRNTARAIGRRRRASGPLWQPRYFDFILRRAADFGEKLEYIHRNPVEAGLAERPEAWPWSSARFYSKAGDVRITPDIFDAPADANTPLWPAPWR